jgi:hypothetical protein
MHIGMALAAKALQVDRVVCAALFNFNNVMNLQLHGWAKQFKVVFSAQAMPAVVTPIRGEQWAQIPV